MEIVEQNELQPKPTNEETAAADSICTMTEPVSKIMKDISLDPYFMGPEKKFIVDFEGYYDRSLGTYVIREMCFLNMETNGYSNFILKNDNKWRFYGEDYFNSYENNTARYCNKYIHYIPDNFCNISASNFKDVVDMFKLLVNHFISKGKDKCRFLSKFFNAKVENVEDFGVPPYKTIEDNYPHMKTYCYYHSRMTSYHCSVYKCNLLSSYIKELKKASKM